MISGQIKFWHDHFFAIPLLTAPTQTLRVNDASTGATTSWIFVHISPFKMKVITME
jgi:hypothetical protein